VRLGLGRGTEAAIMMLVRAGATVDDRADELPNVLVNERPVWWSCAGQSRISPQTSGPVEGAAPSVAYQAADDEGRRDAPTDQR
jgi:hypothetical protein